MLNKSWQLALGTIATSLLMGASVAQAFTLSIGNKALNTNWKFRRIDGTPRMSIWDLNPRDNDQQFEILSQPGYNFYLIKHRSTGMCLNAHYLRRGAEINVWKCNFEDPDQRWYTISGPSSMIIQRVGTDLCIEAPNLVNGGRVQLQTCNVRNPNQEWKVRH